MQIGQTNYHRETVTLLITDEGAKILSLRMICLSVKSTDPAVETPVIVLWFGLNEFAGYSGLARKQIIFVQS